MPTAFSPNGDGINDYFFPQGDGFELIIMRIFDRWGGLVFEGNRNHSIWDGQMNGKPVTSGLYPYVAQFRELASGRTVARQGHVLLLR
ncbi:gliding motility-associated C-terminal domain-containing protein [Phaeodactylibacter sp.]|uniref:gliding motility-associated C-terminal domain-containing protein n=1 Tax=Phaeodactylibacter sp. TaxID=1940289 RepID=UPI0034203A6E